MAIRRATGLRDTRAMAARVRGTLEKFAATPPLAAAISEKTFVAEIMRGGGGHSKPCHDHTNNRERSKRRALARRQRRECSDLRTGADTGETMRKLRRREAGKPSHTLADARSR